MNNHHPLVTIAIPAYKSTFLKEAIESALNQTHRNIELIIVNDCSPEDVDRVVLSYNDARIKYYKNAKNLGGENPAYNWNKCLSYASGDFFALLCDDDIYESTFIEKMLLLAEKYPQTNVFRTRADIIDFSGKRINQYPSAPEWENLYDYMWHVFKNCRYQTISEWLFRREILIKGNGYALLPLAWYADYLTVYKYAEKGGIASSYEFLVHFRQSGSNISSKDDQNTIKKLEASKQYIEECIKIIKNNLFENSDVLYWLLRHHVKNNSRYSLNHAPKLTLCKVLYNRKRYGLSFHMIWKALWHKRN